MIFAFLVGWILLEMPSVLSPRFIAGDLTSDRGNVGG